MKRVTPTRPFNISEYIRTEDDLAAFTEAWREESGEDMDAATFAELLESVKQMDEMVRNP